MSNEKTEKPSAKRLKDARERGQVARSRELVAALTLVGVTLTLARIGPSMLSALTGQLSSSLSHLGDHARGTLAPGDLTSLAIADFRLFAIVVAPIALAVAVVTIAGNVAQGWVFAPQALQINWSRLSPANGFARFKPAQGGLELVKAAFNVTVLTWVAYGPCREIYADAPRLVAMTPLEAGTHAWAMVWSLLWRAGLAILGLSAADYAVQRWRWYSGLKMTRQEVRDESKSSEGNPEIKARVRRIQREMGKRRMLKDVKTATVVVTNPTHFAVALQYHRQSMAAPKVVAKGQDLLAARIRTIAREAGVPIVENVALARALHKTAEVGDVIPASLFSAVAEVLAYLVRIRQLMF